MRISLPDRLNHEAKLLASVNHPCVASVYGLEEADTVCGIVMEYVSGVVWTFDSSKVVWHPGPSHCPWGGACAGSSA